MEYVVAGYNMLNDIVYADGTRVDGILGGSVFSLGGIKLWRDSLAYVGVAGKDYMDHYGPFLTRNNIKASVEPRLEYTLDYVLTYQPDGSWNEACKYGDEWEDKAYENSRFGADAFAEFVGPDTKGVYIEASLSTQIIYEFSKLKAMMPNGKLMWEIVTGDLLDPACHDKLMEIMETVDFYSVNFNEAKVFFNIATEEEAIEKMLAIGKPCFFRCGDKGAYLINNGNVSFLAAVGVEESVGETGCGNCSTATALIGLAEGLPDMETLAMANISAYYCAKQYGPWEYTDEKVRAEATALKDKLLK